MLVIICPKTLVYSTPFISPGFFFSPFVISVIFVFTIAPEFIGIITLIAFIVVLDYMKTRLGLAPEEYRKQDIEFIPKVKQLTSQDIEKNNIEISISIDENGENRIDISDIN